MKHLCLIFSILILISKQSLSNSIAAGEIAYEWISDSTYRFYFKLYRGCPGDTAPATIPLCFRNQCINSGFTVTLSRWNAPIPGIEVRPFLNPGCSWVKTSCDSIGAAIPGYRVQWYHAFVTLPSRCNAWKIFTYINSRIASNNIQSVGSIPFYSECTFNNTGSYRINSSPYFSLRGFEYALLNQPNSYHNGTVDPDGDSLVTEIISPATGVFSCSDASQNVNLSVANPVLAIPNNPFQTNNTLTLSSNGLISFTPTQLGNNTLTCKVKEYRNGVLIGSVIRDINIVVLPYIQDTQKFVATIDTTCNAASALGLPMGPTRIESCIGKSIDFCFYVKSAIAGSRLIVSDNRTLISPNATITYYNQGADSVKGIFHWMPGRFDGGLKNLVITVKDSTCRPPGIMLYSTNIVPIYITPATNAMNDTIICPGDSATLSVTGSSNYTWSVISGSSSLSCTNCEKPVVKPSVTTTFQVISTANAACGFNSDNILVEVLPKIPLLNAGNDTAICEGESAILKASWATSWNGSLQWNNITGTNGSLSCTQCITPVAKPSSSTGYILTSFDRACNSANIDTVYVNVLPANTNIPTVTISANYWGYAVKNSPIIFSAMSNGCNNPSFQWILNGSNVTSANSNKWTAYLQDSIAYVQCRLTCNDICMNEHVQLSNEMVFQVVNHVGLIKNKNHVDIYPNPSNDGIFTISANRQMSNMDLVVINCFGQTVYAEKGMNIISGSSKTLNLQQQPAGIYTIKLGDIPYCVIISK